MHTARTGKLSCTKTPGSCLTPARLHHRIAHVTVVCQNCGAHVTHQYGSSRRVAMVLDPSYPIRQAYSGGSGPSLLSQHASKAAAA
jgi:hypothetical protein